jgi:hypothetical protein
MAVGFLTSPAMISSGAGAGMQYVPPDQWYKVNPSQPLDHFAHIVQDERRSGTAKVHAQALQRGADDLGAGHPQSNPEWVL